MKISFTQIDNSLILDSNLDAYQFRIYSYLLSLYNKEKSCAYPSMETISEKLNISLSKVKKSIKHLSELGYITIEKRQAKIGNYNIYTKLKHLITKNNIEVEDIKTPEEIKKDKIINHTNVRIIRKYVDIDRNEGLREVVTSLSNSRVREGIRSFNEKVANGKWEVKCAANLFREIIDVYYQENAIIPWKAFNYYKKYMNNIAVQPK